MPLIKVQTSIANPAQEKVKDLLKSLSSKLAKHLSKPESYVMTIFESELLMSFAGNFDPVCYLEIKSVGTISSNQTQAMSKDFCSTIRDNLGIPENRIYIEFAEAKGYLWGWNGSTF